MALSPSDLTCAFYCCYAQTFFLSPFCVLLFVCFLLIRALVTQFATITFKMQIFYAEKLSDGQRLKGKKQDVFLSYESNT